MLVGNGINREFNDPSWTKIIEDALKIYHSPLTLGNIEDMPATMQIVVATGDNVEDNMSRLSRTLLDIKMTDDRIEFLRQLLSVPVDDILTTNYSFELEVADGMPMSKSAYSHAIRKTKEVSSSENVFRLFHFYLTKNEHRIWHIHGDIANKSTMLMGHYHYAKQLHAIQKCVEKTIKKEKLSEKNGYQFQPDNWVDLFLMGDIYILGFGMYLCESDLWYLACCKKRHFPFSNIYYYEFNQNDQHKGYMFEAYGIKVIDEKKLSATSYRQFYLKAMNDIQSRIERRRLI